MVPRRMRKQGPCEQKATLAQKARVIKRSICKATGVFLVSSLLSASVFGVAAAKEPWGICNPEAASAKDPEETSTSSSGAVMTEEPGSEHTHQGPPEGAGLEGEGYTAVVYTNQNGLPTSEANALAQTGEGFLWIGSYSGLIRYDGNTFERMSSSKTGISGVVELFVDSKGRLWIGSNDIGAAVYENGTFRVFNKEQGLPALYVKGISEDPDGNIYLGTSQGVVMVDSEMNIHPLDCSMMSDTNVMEMVYVSSGQIYGLTREGCLFVIEHGKVTQFLDTDKLGFKGAHAVYPDSEQKGFAFIGDDENTIRRGQVLGGSFHVEEEYSTGPLSGINSMYRIDDMLWISTDNGIGFLRNGHIAVLNTLPLNADVEGMIQDYLGNMWFCSSKKGVMKMTPNQFFDVFHRTKVGEKVVYGTCATEDGILVGTQTGLIMIHDADEITSFPIKKMVSSNKEFSDTKDLIEMMKNVRIRSIIRDSKGGLWFSTYGDTGLIRYQDGVAYRLGVEDGLPSDRIRTVVEMKDGRMLVCGTGGLTILKDGKVEKVYDNEDGLANTEVLTAVEMSDGKILVGTDGGGLYVMDGDKLRHFGTGEGLKSDVILRLRKGRTGNLIWIVTSNSIAYMDEKLNPVTIEHFPYSNNFDLFENTAGEMWILSSDGIYICDVSNLLKNETIDYIHYGVDDGLTRVPGSNSYSDLTSDGDLYIACSTGVVKINIEKDIAQHDRLKSAIPWIEVDGEKVFPDENGRFVIGSNAKKVTITGYVFNYTLVNPKVSYHLDGFEEEWTTVLRSELTPVTYTNLRGGEYHFQMRVSDPRGGNTSEMGVTIIKREAPLEKTWVQVLLILLGAAIAMLIARFYAHYKTERLIRKAEEQKQLIREIVEAFAKVIDMKDQYTNGHSDRVADYTVMLARELGYDEETVDKFYNIALLHDIGKIGIRKEVLNKPGRLTDEEFAEIKSHTVLGANVLKDISIMPELSQGAESHHERPDGKGYPHGLKGDKIPRAAQIIAVADCFDAMYSDRPYRKRMNFDKVVSIIRDARGTQLTADVVDAFLRLVEKGEFRSPEDHGGGTTEDIDNIHKRLAKQAEEEKAAEAKAGETRPEEDKPAEETTSEGKSADGKPSEEKTSEEKPAEGKNSEEKSSDESSAEENGKS